MELKQRLSVLKKRLVLILAITAAATLISGILSYFVVEYKYKADVSVIIGDVDAKGENSGSDYYDLIMYQTLVKTYSKLAMSRTVAEDVISKLNLSGLKTDDLLSMVQATADKDTQFLTISVTAESAEKSMNIANQFAKSLCDVSYNIYKKDNVKIIEKAVLPASPVSPKPLLNIGAAFFISALFSIGLAYLLEYMDNTIKTREDVEELGMSLLGTVSLVKKNKDVIIC